MTELEQHLLAWWEDKRPFGWDVVEHLDSPLINCTRMEKPLGAYAAELARAVQGK